MSSDDTEKQRSVHMRKTPTWDDIRERVKVIGDTPEHARHLIWDSHTDVYVESNGGLAFSIGVACIEAETARDPNRFWKVCHANGTELYHVVCASTLQIIVTKVY